MVVVSLSVSLGLVACGTTESSGDPTPVQTFKITPAPSRTDTPGPQPSPTADASSSPQSGASASEPIIIAGINSEFDIEEISAPPGSITIEFDNRDGGVIHNIHFFQGEDNDGDTVAESELEVGPIVQTLTFDVAPGTYFYQCDAHPTTMEGLLTVP